MLNINSISVAPWPQQAASVKAQPVTTAKASSVVSKSNLGTAVSVAPAADVGKVQVAVLPSSLPPVNPLKEAVGADMRNNSAAPERSAEVAPWMAIQARNTPNAAATDAIEPSESNSLTSGIQGKTNPAAVAEEQAAPRDAQEAFNASVKAEAARQADPGKRPSAIGELPTDPKDPVDLAMETQIKELLPNLWKASRAAVDVLIGEEAKAAAAERAARFDEGLADAASAVAEMVAQEASESYKAQTAEAAQIPAPGSQVSKMV